MKSRMQPFSGSSPYFRFRLFLVFILLQDISAQPVTNGRTLMLEDQRPPWQHQERWPPRIPGQPLPYLYECIHILKVPDRPKTPHPVLFPYTVPIPWPTPFNGTNYAPVPQPISPVPSIPTEISSDTYPLYIPVPQFQFIPFYYNAPDTAKAQPCPVKQTRPVKTKPISRPREEPVTTEPAEPQTPPPSRIPARPHSARPRPKPLDPVREEQRPYQPKTFIPPLKHTWVPPPENLPEYIPPQQSFLHTRSSVPSSDKDHYDYVTYEPDYYTVGDAYSSPRPEIYSYHPESYSYYDPYYFGPYYTHLNRPGVVTSTDTTKYDKNFVTHAPAVVTYTEKAHVPASTRPASKQPTYVTYESGTTSTKPTEDEEDYVTYDPDVYTTEEEAPAVPSSKSAQPQQPSYTTYESSISTTSERQPGATSSKTSPAKVAPTSPKRPTSTRPSTPTQLPSSYATYDSDIVTVTRPTKGDSGYRTYRPDTITFTEESPVPSSSTRATPAKPSRPSYRPTSTEQKPYGSDAVTGVEPAYRFYGPDTITFTEEAPVPQRTTSAKPSRPSYQPPTTRTPLYVTYDSGTTSEKPTEDEDDYVTYEPDVYTTEESAPAVPSSKRAQTQQPSYVTYESGISTSTDRQPSGTSKTSPAKVAPTSPKRPKTAKTLPSNQPSGRQPYATYNSQYVTISDPANDGSGSMVYEPETVTFIDGAPAPTAKRSTTSSQQAGATSGKSQAATLPEADYEYYDSEPSFYTVVEDPNGKETIYDSNMAGQQASAVPDNVGASKL